MSSSSLHAEGKHRLGYYYPGGLLMLGVFPRTPYCSWEMLEARLGIQTGIPLPLHNLTSGKLFVFSENIGTITWITTQLKYDLTRMRGSRTFLSPLVEKKCSSLSGATYVFYLKNMITDHALLNFSFALWDFRVNIFFIAKICDLWLRVCMLPISKNFSPQSILNYL